MRIRAASALARLALATVTVAAIAACGSGATASTTPTAGVATPEPSEASTADAAVPEVESSEAAAVPAELPSGGGTTVGVCSLVTVDELAGILGVPVKTAVIAGPPDTCDVQSADGAPLAAFVLTSIGGVSASTVYDAYASDQGATTVPGIGEKAAYDPGQGLVVVLKNGAVLSVAVFDDGSSGEAALLELMKKIATIAAGRM